ncbi:hypothetical protein MHBO_002628 [Bonamia ostreae]|uniref:Sushi domain-containing protein n=1 Tax=Bonamia ostreae TaxID=126728 RepID=A0ABV2AN00_9EUKA
MIIGIVQLLLIFNNAHKIKNLTTEFDFKYFPRELKETREEFLSKGFTKVEDANTDFSDEVVFRCSDLTNKIKINKNANEFIVDFLYYALQETLITIYGDNFGMSCVDIANWKLLNPAHCTVPESLPAPLFRADFIKYIKNKSSAYSGCESKTSPTYDLETMECQNSKITESNCSSLSSNKACGIDKLSKGLYTTQSWTTNFVSSRDYLQNSYCRKDRKNFGQITCINGAFDYEANIPEFCDICDSSKFSGRVKPSTDYKKINRTAIKYNSYICKAGCNNTQKGSVWCTDTGIKSVDACNCFCTGKGPDVKGLIQIPKNVTNEGEFMNLKCVAGFNVVGFYKCVNKSWVGSPRCVPQNISGAFSQLSTFHFLSIVILVTFCYLG